MNKADFGLAIDLKKRRFYLDSDDTNDYDYLTFGSFDGLIIRKISDLSGFIPKFEDDLYASGVNSEEILGSFDSPHYEFESEKYISTFILKLLNSGNRSINKWYEKKEDGLLFFSIIMLNISEEVAKAFSINEEGSKRLFEFLTDSIHKIIQSMGSKEIYCDIYETFGYYDFVILIKTSALVNIKIISDKLREIKVAHNSVFSAVYTIFGIKNCKDKKYVDIMKKGSKDISSIIIDFHLRNVASIEMIKTKISNLYPDFKVSLLFSEGESNVSMVIKGENTALIFIEYFVRGNLNPENDWYKDNVLSMKTRLFFNSASINNDIQNTKSSSYELSESCSKIYCDYAKLVQKENRIQRRTTSLRQLVQRYYNIARYNHSFEIRNLLRPVFESLFLNMEKSNKYIEGQKDSVNKERAKKGRYNDDVYKLELDELKIWSSYDEAIDCFREEVGSFISDISLSDKYFIENSQLKHPSIGSATKLIFFYNYLVNKVVKEFNYIKDESQYNFLVKSGGRDEVKVKNLFDFLPHYDLNNRYVHRENCLLIIEIPERLLYNIPVTLCATLHEVFHIIGDRDRILRLKKILEGISVYLACEFTHRQKKKYHATYTEKNECDSFEFIKNKIDENIYDILSSKICKSLEVNSFNEINELDVYSKYITGLVFELVFQLLQSDETSDESGSYNNNSLRHIVLSAWKEIVSAMYKNDDKAADGDFINNVSKYVDKYLTEYYPENKDESFMEEFEKIKSEIEEKIYDDIEDFIEAFIEVYSEYMAICTLNLNVVDYLIYICCLKEGSESELIVLNANSVLRYGVILDYMYSNNIDMNNYRLHKDIEDNFNKSVSELQEKSIISDKVCVDVILKRISELLRKYYSIYSSEGEYGNCLANKVKEYLGEIKSDFDSNVVNDIRNIYDVFNKRNNNDECKEIIMNSWLKLAENH